MVSLVSSKGEEDDGTICFYFRLVCYHMQKREGAKKGENFFGSVAGTNMKNEEEEKQRWVLIYE